MKVTHHLLIMVLLCSAAKGLAYSHEFRLTAGDSIVDLDFSTKRDLRGGYFKTGIGGVLRDHDGKEYQILDGLLSMGSESLIPGLQCDLGFRGLLGKVEKDRTDGNVGAFGFNVEAVYAILEDTSSVPVEIMGGITWAPNVLSFSDLDGYQEFTLGLGFRVVENAAVILDYSSRRYDMKNDWTLKDHIVSLGLSIRW